ncbi:glutamate-cysteine ligase family protein [Longispora urticae]
MNAVLIQNMLSEKEATAYVASAGFRAGSVGSVGTELEWLVRDPSAPLSRPAPDRLRDAVRDLPDPLPGGGRITIEPGGQLELSSGVGASLAECVANTRADMALLTAAVEAAGLRLEGGGLDMLRPAFRVLDTPRYEALERFNDRSGPEGRVVACNSASVQVCLDSGDDTDGWLGYRRRWWLADAMGPMLLAIFANSPGTAGGHRWRSTRQVLRFAMDSGRTRAPRMTDDPRKEWARYALAAKVSVVASEDGADWTAPEGLTMRDWLRGGGPRPATYIDLEMHLGTLVPPVRPRGYLEFRMIDQQDGENWVVPVALVTGLMDDAVTAERAAEVVRPLRSLRRNHDWVTAARRGLGEPGLTEAATACFDLALEGLDRLGAPADIRERVADFAQRYTVRGRCPADDVAARRVRAAVAVAA